MVLCFFPRDTTGDTTKLNAPRETLEVNLSAIFTKKRKIYTISKYLWFPGTPLWSSRRNNFPLLITCWTQFLEPHATPSVRCHEKSRCRCAWENQNDAVSTHMTLYSRASRFPRMVPSSSTRSMTGQVGAVNGTSSFGTSPTCRRA